MAKLVLLDVKVTVNAVTLSDHAASCTINSKKDIVDATGMGSTYKNYLIGLGDATIEVEFEQDFAASSVDATLWPLHSGGTSFTVVILPTSAGPSATNPSYTMTAILPEFSPLDGGIGELSKTKVTFQNAGTTGIVRATS